MMIDIFKAIEKNKQEVIETIKTLNKHELRWNRVDVEDKPATVIVNGFYRENTLEKVDIVGIRLTEEGKLEGLVFYTDKMWIDLDDMYEYTENNVYEKFMEEYDKVKFNNLVDKVNEARYSLVKFISKLAGDKKYGFSEEPTVHLCSSQLGYVLDLIYNKNGKTFVEIHDDESSMFVLAEDLTIESVLAIINLYNLKLWKDRISDI